MTSCLMDKKTLFISKPSQETGIFFQNNLTNTLDFNILSYLYFYNGAGIATADFNQDGLIDLYFTSNQEADQLYLNQGGFKFTNVSSIAQIDNDKGWTTGVTHVDINHDGLLDIYVSKVAGYLHLEGHNLLYLNLGNNADGIPIFKESSAEFGLDFVGFTTQSVFFDYDLDNDLDVFLLNHSVYPNRSYGNGENRKTIDYFSGDKLLENQEGKFVDVTEKAKIHQGKIGYGLGVSIGDINNDRYPDIYVGNDFFENDYLYLNNQDGTFQEIVSNSSNLGHTSHYSMGNAIADINNDGFPEIISLDMLPEDLITYKTSGLEYPYPIYQHYLNNGYKPQFMQNTLHLNLGKNKFSEIAFSSGIAATEWSWSPVVADFDNDGWKDLFITNGILGATNDMDYVNFISNEKIQKKINEGLVFKDFALIKEIPSKKTPNYFFKNNRNLSFSNTTTSWSKVTPNYSNGAAYADLDNDGDLDLVINNVNSKAEILENTIANTHSIQLQFEGPKKNTKGIGVKVKLTERISQNQELFTSRGYLSAVSNRLHFGISSDTLKCSLTVLWPDGKSQYLTDVPIDSLLTIRYKEANQTYYQSTAKDSFEFLMLEVDFIHQENLILDFSRQPIIPFASSNEGPAIAVSDFNGDELDDFIITGAKNQPTTIYVQTPNGNFDAIQENLMKIHELHEDTCLALFDADGDDDIDLLIGSGGNEFQSGDPLKPRLYINDKGLFLQSKYAFGELEINASTISVVDFDNDADLDVMFTSNGLPAAFGVSSKQYFFKNNGNGKFTNVSQEVLPELHDMGIIKDTRWIDIDDNGFKDLITVGYWENINIFLNSGKKLTLQKNNGLESTEGWWNCLEVADVDGDGDLDIVAGNWGTNSRFTATNNDPIILYLNDFDANGSLDPLLTYSYKGIETTFASKEELTKQFPFLNKVFRTYKDFAKSSVDNAFGTRKLESALKKKVVELRSCFFENKEGVFVKKPLPLLAQIAPVNAIELIDKKNGLKDMLFFGNNLYVSTQLGQLDANRGILINQKSKGNFSIDPLKSLGIDGVVNDVSKILIDNKETLIVGRNNKSAIFIQKKSYDSIN